MTPKEMREAAKCILNMDCECDSYHGYRCGKCNTLAPLARHILATVRDDDDKPADDIWQMDIAVANDFLPYTETFLYDVWTGGHGKTRGQFRQLCEGLGIQLKEAT